MAEMLDIQELRFHFQDEGPVEGGWEIRFGGAGQSMHPEATLVLRTSERVQIDEAPLLYHVAPVVSPD